MKHLFALTENGVKHIGTIENNDSTITQSTFPAREQREGFKAVLAYNMDEGVHWEYVPLINAEKREKAYQTEPCVEFEGKTLTVDEANKLWQIYQAEGHYKAMELTAVIASAKNAIREKYPD